MHGEIRITYKIFVGKLEGKKPFRRRRCGLEDSVEMDLREMELEVVDWTNLAQDRYL